MIGVVLPKIDSATIGSMVSGILNLFNESGYQLLIADTQNNPEKELEYLSAFDDKKVDSSYVSVRIDGKTKQLAREKLAKRGLSISAYIRLMLTDVAESVTVTYPDGRKL